MSTSLNIVITASARLLFPQVLYQQFNEQRQIIQNLSTENSKLNEKIVYLENKMKQLITAQIEKRKEEKANA